MKTTSPARPDTSAALWVWPTRPSSPTAGQSSSQPPPRPPASPPASHHPPPPFLTAASGRRMRRERSILEAFLTKIKPTIFCLVSKALPLPRLAPAFPTGQCRVRLYHRGDLADSSRFFPIPSASTPGERGFKDSLKFDF